MKRKKIIIGSRASKLALIYSEKAKKEISKYFKGEIIIKKINTKGDNYLQVRLAELGGKGLFSSNIENELQEKKIDLAVHALKDLPTFESKGLVTNCFLKRNETNDVMISKSRRKFSELKPGSIIGTSSFRREFQLKKIRKDLNFKLIRGNVDTRLKKLKDGEYDAIFLSKAGLMSLQLGHEITQEFKNKEMIPSAGQGTIALQCRKDDNEMTNFLKQINHLKTSISVKSEREVLKVLEGDCETAVGSISEIIGNKINIAGELFSIDGTRRYYYETTKNLSDAIKAGIDVGNQLKNQSKGNYKK
tara:strand:- start:202 stop:1113 length:912 start_codon:yes stop_codon:yes gene_type:complete